MLWEKEEEKIYHFAGLEIFCLLFIYVGFSTVNQ